MRTTVRMQDELLRRAKEVAAQRDTTLTAILEQALREWLDHQGRKKRRRPVALPVSRSGDGLLPGIDLDDSANLLDRMENDGPA
ncbi:MAG: ribbon-helix-helix protein, CopG family [Deltaproteobacteria bacterium]|nr:ribbon-helix-helix protein, CopG family [Deltaproteobacteria bacterium]MBW2420504.1 ribbon-helix-helix protein, CopG family [Deltaproteobacteria bacterium]